MVFATAILGGFSIVYSLAFPVAFNLDVGRQVGKGLTVQVGKKCKKGSAVVSPNFTVETDWLEDVNEQTVETQPLFLISFFTSHEDDSGPTTRSTKNKER